MNYKTMSLGLAALSFGLAAAEILAPKKITKALDAEGHEKLVRGFGVRELVAGLGLLQAPAHSVRVWNRVAGDAMDIAALGLATKNSPKNKAVWGALAFVGVATALDILTAIGLDKETGKTLPTSAGHGGTAEATSGDHYDPNATSPEPTHTAQGRAPAVALA